LSIPPEYREQAEHVRAHLVHLRGGAPFLSPADALRLVTWLDEGVKVSAILAALDRCVVSRRKNKARTPLTLTAAGRHLGKAPLTPLCFEPTPGAHPFQPVFASLRATDDPEAAVLAEALNGIDAPESEARVTEAVAICRKTYERRWAGLTVPDREGRIAVAMEDLGDIANVVDGDTLRKLAEEVAREAFRSAWPRLDTATFEALATA